MTREMIGLDTFLFTFTLEEYNEYVETKNAFKPYGKVTERFINNAYGFEVKLYRRKE
jgi:hypothetical protein